MLTAFCKLASFFNEHIWGWNGHQHDFCVISVIGIHRIVNSIRQQWGLNLVLVEDMESGCILDFESVMHRKGFHPRMISHEKVRGDVHIGITFLQIIHITIKENHISMSNFQNFFKLTNTYQGSWATLSVRTHCTGEQYELFDVEDFGTLNVTLSSEDFGIFCDWVLED